MTAYIIQLNDQVVRADDVFTTDLDGEMGMIHIETGKYYAFEDVSRSIWELVESPIYVNEIVGALMNDYEVDEATCSNQTLQFLQTLYQLNLIHLSPTKKIRETKGASIDEKN